MAIGSVCATFRRIAISKQSNSIIRYSSTHLLKEQNNILLGSNFSNNILCRQPPTTHIRFVPRTLNIDFEVPASNTIIKNIVEIPFKNVPSMEEPLKQHPLQQDIPLSDKSLELPTNNDIIEKQAVRLLVIRRRKMKKHQRRKLRKKMKFEWAKIRMRRNKRREKLFQSELLAKITEAQNFKPKEYVQQKLAYLKKERISNIWRGEILPSTMVKQFMLEKQAKKEAKRKHPRLTPK